MSVVQISEKRKKWFFGLLELCIVYENGVFATLHTIDMSSFFSGFGRTVVCRLGYNSVRHSLAVTHLSGPARIRAHIGMLGNPNQCTKCFIRGGARVPCGICPLARSVKA